MTSRRMYVALAALVTACAGPAPAPSATPADVAVSEEPSSSTSAPPQSIVRFDASACAFRGLPALRGRSLYVQHAELGSPPSVLEMSIDEEHEGPHPRAAWLSWSVPDFLPSAEALEACCAEPSACDEAALSFRVDESLVPVEELDRVADRDREPRMEWDPPSPSLAYCECLGETPQRVAAPSECPDGEGDAACFHVHSEFRVGGRRLRILHADAMSREGSRIERRTESGWRPLAPTTAFNTGEVCSRGWSAGPSDAWVSSARELLLVRRHFEMPTMSTCDPGVQYAIHRLAD